MNEFQVVENSRLTDETRENQFPLHVMAFDFATGPQDGEELLRFTKMSTPPEGTTLPSIPTVLIVAGFLISAVVPVPFGCVAQTARAMST